MRIRLGEDRKYLFHCLRYRRYHRPLYVTSPTGLRGLSHSYAAQIDDLRRYSKDGCAGLIETDMVRHIEAKPGLIPIGRFGGAEEIADTVLMLARNSYITGQTTNVNGGLYFS